MQEFYEQAYHRELELQSALSKGEGGSSTQHLTNTALPVIRGWKGEQATRSSPQSSTPPGLRQHREGQEAVKRMLTHTPWHAGGRVTLIHRLPSIRLPDRGNRIVNKNGN